MSIDTYQRQVATYQKNIAKLQADKGKAAAKAADLQKKQGDALAAARRTTSQPTIKAKQRDADRYGSDHAKAMTEIAKLDSKIASEQKKQLDAQHRLDQEVAKQQKKHLADQKKSEAESKKQAIAQKREDQAHELRMPGTRSCMLRPRCSCRHFRLCPSGSLCCSSRLTQGAVPPVRWRSMKR